MVKVAVLGAGIVGVSSALHVQQAMPHARVSIVADSFDDDTVSNGAGGYFRPYLGDSTPRETELTKRWARQTFDHYSRIAKSPEAGESGCFFVNGILAYHTPQDEPYTLLKELVCDFHRLSDSDVKKFGLAGKYEYCYGVTTMVTQTSKLLPWLMKRFKKAGGQVQTRTVKQLSELSPEFDVVINCCGLGARELVGDSTVFPVKGHLVWLRAPWFKLHFFSQESIYMIPHEEKLVVGGIREKDNYDLTPDPEKRKLILSRAEALFPQLKGAEVLGEWCGLRPARQDGVRLELEAIRAGSNRVLPVVHNYGHGGHGVTLSWGCGFEAAQLVKEAVKGVSPSL